MALRALLIALAVISMVVAPAMATEHLVGDDQGWKVNFDYNKWAESKEFHVGDKLIFKYKEGVHNVYKADLTAFQNCAPGANVEPLTTGNDVIELKSTGKKWYLCGIKNHCDQGMKVAVNVLPEVLGAPSTAPASPPVSSSAFGISPNSLFVALMIAAFAMFLIIIA
ncbi:blue copper protein 1a-like [Lycium barbarum]|uniref:blue copper protein 1a-like n=1 Tax=Lycium barbarum TaxID=112863 RepID=UPI00293E0FE5|nr:blue copper protein 1a-like [Lycium barbarum]